MKPQDPFKKPVNLTVQLEPNDRDRLDILSQYLGNSTHGYAIAQALDVAWNVPDFVAWRHPEIQKLSEQKAKASAAKAPNAASAGASA